MFTRTLQTLLHSTILIEQFQVLGIQCEFQLRKLNAAREHYIIVTSQSMQHKHLWEDIKVVTEVITRFDRLQFRIEITSQCPELADAKDDIIEHVKRILKNSTV